MQNLKVFYCTILLRYTSQGYKKYFKITTEIFSASFVITDTEPKGYFITHGYYKSLFWEFYECKKRNNAVSCLLSNVIFNF